MNSVTVYAGLVCVVLPLVGCALLMKSETTAPRYFSAGAPVSLPAASKVRIPCDLRLGSVSSASHLDEHIAFRMSAEEVGFYTDRRWTEIPEEYLRRALERELFEVRGVQRVMSSAAPTLDVELLAFEEVRGGTVQALVAARFTVRAEDLVLLQDSVSLTMSIKRPSGNDSAQQLAATLSLALTAAAERIASATIGQLQCRAESRVDSKPE
ncbi:MAG: hypothetical protein RJA70_4524 [Pseudomonadota bacterium]|jgi:cholesterol transport system auxiliary component